MSMMNTNSRRLQDFREKYSGRRCFIMGNGPSLNKTRLDLLANELVWGFNKIYLLFDKITWRPKFYVTNDLRLTEHISNEINSLITQLSDSFFFFPTHFSSREVRNTNKNVYWYKEMPWNELTGRQTLFSRDPSHYIVNTATVTIAGLQLAAYLGFNPIYLIGCDTSYSIPASVKSENRNPQMLTSTENDDPNHFVSNYSGKGDRWTSPNVPLMMKQYEHAQRILNESNIKVYNATVGGDLNVFPRIDFESLFQ